MVYRHLGMSSVSLTIVIIHAIEYRLSFQTLQFSASFEGENKWSVLNRTSSFGRENGYEFRGRVFGWMSEYSERNHARMFEVVTKLKQIEMEYHHPDFDVPGQKKSFSVLLRY